jgi:hypothetical protein
MSRNVAFIQRMGKPIPIGYGRSCEARRGKDYSGFVSVGLCIQDLGQIDAEFHRPYTRLGILYNRDNVGTDAAAAFLALCTVVGDARFAIPPITAA